MAVNPRVQVAMAILVGRLLAKLAEEIHGSYMALLVGEVENVMLVKHMQCLQGCLSTRRGLSMRSTIIKKSCSFILLSTLKLKEMSSPFHDGGRYHIETSSLICSANPWTGFYMTTASVMKGLN